MPNIAHIINPVIVGETSDLHAAQPVTFESMRRARDYAAGEVGVELYSAQYPEDAALVPPWISATPDLSRSVLNAGTFGKQRKLPLIGDILERLYEASTADYFIYTNVDIALMPHFYTAVAQLIESGIDAMALNRRTISKEPCVPSQIPLMWAQVGEKHPGHDCFVFSRDMLPKFNMGLVCIGAAWVGRVLIWNLCVHSSNFHEFTDMHLTFHLGNDKLWKNQSFSDYENYNRIQATNVLNHLNNTHGPFTEASQIWPYLTPDPRESLEKNEDLTKRAGLVTRLFTR